MDALCLFMILQLFFLVNSNMACLYLPPFWPAPVMPSLLVPPGAISKLWASRCSATVDALL